VDPTRSPQPRLPPWPAPTASRSSSFSPLTGRVPLTTLTSTFVSSNRGHSTAGLYAPHSSTMPARGGISVDNLTKRRGSIPKNALRQGNHRNARVNHSNRQSISRRSPSTGTSACSADDRATTFFPVAFPKRFASDPSVSTAVINYFFRLTLSFGQDLTIVSFRCTRVWRLAVVPDRDWSMSSRIRSAGSSATAERRLFPLALIRREDRKNPLGPASPRSTSAWLLRELRLPALRRIDSCASAI
jgi:hypothetical protein